MPELPEVEHLRLSLIPRLVGHTVVGARIHRRDVVVTPGDPAGGFARAGRAVRPRSVSRGALLDGARIAELRRLGKQLAIIADDGRTICIHLGMSGQVRWQAPGARRMTDRHQHVVWRLDDGSTLIFRDQRRFGGVWTYPEFHDLLIARWSALGPDALAVTAAQLAAGLDGTDRPLKAALLDQSVIAGVGNIYADEALFIARLSPTRLASQTESKDLSALAAAIRRVMRASIAAGGSTLRDYVDGEGNPGGNQSAFAVYGRGGGPCVVCGGTLTTFRVAQRSTVMCSACQK